MAGSSAAASAPAGASPSSPPALPSPTRGPRPGWWQRGRTGVGGGSPGRLAELVGEALPRPAGDAVTFVPAVLGRELWRGHNPAQQLAQELGRQWHLPVLRLLVRARSPRPQRGLRLEERRRNVAGAFRSCR